MTKKKAKTATVKKTTERSSSCPIFQRIMSFSLEEKRETRLLKITKRRIKREAAKLRRAEDQKQAEVEENSSSTAGDDDAASRSDDHHEEETTSSTTEAACAGTSLPPREALF
jgi:phosphopantothenoylcysteine synthetase/decarboxylase